MCTTVSKGEELAWGVIDGETLPEKPDNRFEPESSYPGLLATLILTVKVKDVQLYIHSRRVQYYTHLFTRALNLTHEQAQMIELAALFHDIGKIALPDALLQKATYLTLEEYEMVKKHPIYSALILIPISILCGKIEERKICSYTMWKGMNIKHGTSNHTSGLASVSG